MDSITVECYDTFEEYAGHTGDVLRAGHIFMLPRWMQAWRQTFQPDANLCLCSVRVNEKEIGLAPLSFEGPVASLIGDPDVCDYLDFTVAPGHGKRFYDTLLEDLSKRGVSELALRCLRPESTVLSYVEESARERNGECSFEADGVTVEMNLPSEWEEYLELLGGKERHEIRRKLRRLEREAEVRFEVLKEFQEISKHLDFFFKLFRESRSDKAAFMTPRMEAFFRLMIPAMCEENVLRFFLLKLNNVIVSTALCFDFQDTMYLYNSGYDPRYSSLSVGLLCKILSVKHSIEIGRKKYDFLKGAELYKYQLGGKDVPLSRCRVLLK